MVTIAGLVINIPPYMNLVVQCVLPSWLFSGSDKTRGRPWCRPWPILWPTDGQFSENSS